MSAPGLGHELKCAAPSAMRRASAQAQLRCRVERRPIRERVSAAWHCISASACVRYSGCVSACLHALHACNALGKVHIPLRERRVAAQDQCSIQSETYHILRRCTAGIGGKQRAAGATPWALIMISRVLRGNREAKHNAAEREGLAARPAAPPPPDRPPASASRAEALTAEHRAVSRWMLLVAAAAHCDEARL